MIKQFFLHILILLIAGSNLSAYNYLPSVKSFDKNDYGAGRQNWDVGVDNAGVVYFGNNDGLLRNIFGIWQLSPTASNDVVRSLCIDQDTIWCGGNAEYGFFVKNSPRDLNYERVGSVNGGSVWNIQCMKNFVYFQTESHVIRYNKKTKTSIDVNCESGYYGICAWNEELWTVTRDGGIGVIEDHKNRTVYRTDKFKGTEVRQLFVHKKTLHLLLFDGRVYTYNGKGLKKLVLPTSIAGKAFFSSLSYNDYSYCVGTISDGLIHIDGDENQVITRVNTDNNLIDNTVLSLARDRNGNLWLGLDYGIAFVELQNAIKPIFDKGATYFIEEFKNSTYLATNKGLFEATKEKPFALFPGSEGQVWRLRTLGDELFVCHNKGLFKMKQNMLESIYIDDGVMDVARFEGTSYYLISSYSGLLLGKYEYSRMRILERMPNTGSPKIVFDPAAQCVWASLQTGSLTKYTIDEDQHILRKEFPGIKNVFACEKHFVFHDGERLLEFLSDSFRPITTAPYNKIVGDNISALDADRNGNRIAYIQNGVPNMLVNLYDGNFHSYQNLLSSVQNNLVKNHEFLDLHNEELRIAIDRGAIAFNLELKTEQTYISKPTISKIVILEGEQEKQTFIYPYNTEVLQFSAGYKDIIFHFGISKSSSDQIEFRYRLWPYDEEWSNWSSNETSKGYTKLKGGAYEFKVESRLNETLVKQETLSFLIDKYWYQTQWVIILYVLFFIVCIIVTVNIMNKIANIKIKREQATYHQSVTKKSISVKNDQLLQYAEVISRKNEFLIELKEGLARMRNSDARQWENKILDEVSSEKKNFFFYKLFSEIHQDFINRLTEKYPQLTSHDVRILSFVRINLGTKEIANLMNISPKSVDINRYRIRKKMGLSHETDLNLFIREL